MKVIRRYAWNLLRLLPVELLQKSEPLVHSILHSIIVEIDEIFCYIFRYLQMIFELNAKMVYISDAVGVPCVPFFLKRMDFQCQIVKIIIIITTTNIPIL